MEIIPFKKSSSFNQEITLDGVPYILQFSWNSRAEFWTMNILDRDQNELVLGVVLVVFHELITKFVDRGLPPGELYVLDPSQNLNELDQYDLLDRASLVYFKEGELV